VNLSADLPARLEARLARPLPGWPAQIHYQPELSLGRHQGPAPATARRAAVLVLLYPRDNAWHLPLMLRPLHMPDHAGQVSLPGGMIEPGETSRQAALREYTEELGPPSDGLRVLGQLTPLYLFASNFQIDAWVAASDVLPEWNPSEQEVERLLQVPLAHLLHPASTSHVERRQRGLEFRAPSFCWDSEQIWGATSMILAELLAAVREATA
jgi:8-oxo-dGTP pyrophosphatase MutT (NUDIX family)